jgi:hypothetical protein
MWQHIICLNCDQNSYIVVTHDNTYTMKVKDELVFVDFFFHPILFVFATNVSCNLSKVTNEILIAIVACE